MKALPKDGIVDVIDWKNDLTYHEVHLWTEGLFDGFRLGKPRYRKEVQGKVTADSWYYKFGFVLGTTLKVTLLLAIAYLGVDVAL